MRIVFEGLSATIEVPDQPGFLKVLRSAAPGWSFEETLRTDEPIARVRARGRSYEILPSWHEDNDFIEATAVSAACSVIVDVITSYIEANPAGLCLHCGSVMLGGRLVVFPGRSRAGKSTLIARLAAAGCMVYGDDVLPLDETDSRGVALGLAPRPRIPLPESASPDFRQFIDGHAAAGDDRYLYLNLEDRLAPRGASAPLGAIVLLDRRDNGPAVFARASRAEALKALIRQNFARAEPADALLDRLHRVMDRMPCLVLSYSDLDEAAELVGRTFSAWPPRLDSDLVATRGTGDDAHEAMAGTASGEPASLSRDREWRRNPTVKLHVVEGQAFLADPDNAAIHHLNVIGTGLWNLLAEGTDQNEAVGVLHGAFPDVDRTVIARDVAALFSALASADFIVPADDRSA
jgi:hypothetical protein